MSFNIPPEQFVDFNVGLSPFCSDFYKIDTRDPKAAKIIIDDDGDGGPSGDEGMSNTGERLTRIEDNYQAMQSKLEASKDGLHRLELMLTRIEGKINCSDEKISGLDRKIDDTKTSLSKDIENAQKSLSKDIDGCVTKFQLNAYALSGAVAFIILILGTAWWTAQQYLLPIIQSLGKATVGA